MEQKKIYFKHLDILRIFLCIAILLYHLNILKGGYLAVCSFFCLSGYLSCISASRKEHFSIKDYYIGRLKKIYLPLVLVVFISIPFTFFIKDIVLLNLKAEVKSILLGYNNFWQLSTNLDYFARHVDSPFMHLWYISILLQFDIIFPLIYIINKKLGDNYKKILPCILLSVISIVGAVYFYIACQSQNIMLSYYSTFTRIFSIFFGLILGFIHLYYKPLIVPKLVTTSKKLVIFYLYLIALLALFVSIAPNSLLYPICMIACTLITCRLIDYSIMLGNEKKEIKIIKLLSKISYEVYLIQYPVIFIFQYLDIKDFYKIPLIIIITLTLSYLLNFALNLSKTKILKIKFIKYVLFIAFVAFSIFGLYKFILAPNPENELKQLENQLSDNEQIVQQKQKEYEQKLVEEQENLDKMLQDIENDESNLHDVVKNLPIVAIGDSVLLGASPKVYERFPNAYIDAAVSRTAWVLNDILNSLKSKKTLGNTIVINLGANGDCSYEQKKQILNNCGERQVFWVNVTNNKSVHVNEGLTKLASEFDNLHIIDWCSISKGHSEYFIADGIHLTNNGSKAYVNTIYDSIYAEYSKEFTRKREELLNNYENEQKNKIIFWGDEFLLGSFDTLQENFNNAKFTIQKSFTYESLKSNVEETAESGNLPNKVVFAIDNTLKLNKEQYEELINLCPEKTIYILSTTKETNEIFYNLDYDNIKVLNFYKSLDIHKNYLMRDGKHLTPDGNKALCKLLEYVNKKM